MKLIIAGSRHLYPSLGYIHNAFNQFDLSEVNLIICGMAKGVDQQAVLYAHQKGLLIKPFYPEWDKFGRSAGPIRNRKMAQYADALLLIWDGKSKGSSNMKLEMQILQKPVFEILTESADDYEFNLR